VTPQEFLDLSHERDLWMARIDAALRWGYLAGYADGQLAEQRRADAEWAAAAPLIIEPGPTHAELEERRWGPGGREHFGAARPGDYPGGPVTQDRRVPA
jgi:hypothetical protein